MKKTKISLIISASILLVACGGETETTSTTTTPEEPVVVIPDPVTTASGNSFDLVKESAINDYTFKYTVLDYTTNEPFADLPIDEFSEPKEGEQLLKVRVEVEAISFRNLLCQEALDAFSIILSEGAEPIKIFQRFSEDFKASLEPTCLELGAKQELTVYFIIPADADLSNATLSLYRGSDYEPSTVRLNP